MNKAGCDMACSYISHPLCPNLAHKIAVSKFFALKQIRGPSTSSCPKPLSPDLAREIEVSKFFILKWITYFLLCPHVQGFTAHAFLTFTEAFHKHCVFHELTLIIFIQAPNPLSWKERCRILPCSIHFQCVMK